MHNFATNKMVFRKKCVSGEKSVKPSASCNQKVELCDYDRKTNESIESLREKTCKRGKMGKKLVHSEASAKEEHKK